MKTKIILFALFAMLLAGNTVAAKENFKDIYAKNIEARGGDALISSLQTYIITGKLVREDSIIFHFRAAFKSPDKSIIEYYHSGDTLAIALDGKQGWTLMPQLGQAPIELPEEKVRESIQLTITPVIQYFNQLDGYKEANNKKSKSKVEVTDNKDSVNNIENYKLICSGSGSDAEIIFVNKTDYLISQINTSFTTGDITQPAIISLRDYRKVNELTIPFYVKIANNKAGIAEITVDSIEVNPPLEDIIFKIPK